MPNSRLGHADGAAAPMVDYDLALVVGSSPVNRIVVSRIAERVGLKVIAEVPEKADRVLLSRAPGTVILDGGPGDQDCACLMEYLAAQRLAAAGGKPFVILLSNTAPSGTRPGSGGTIDAVVAKPITPERLAPLIQRMMDRVRD